MPSVTRAFLERFTARHGFAVGEPRRARTVSAFSPAVQTVVDRKEHAAGTRVVGVDGWAQRSQHRLRRTRSLPRGPAFFYNALNREAPCYFAVPGSALTVFSHHRRTEKQDPGHDLGPVIFFCALCLEASYAKA